MVFHMIAAVGAAISRLKFANYQEADNIRPYRKTAFFITWSNRVLYRRGRVCRPKTGGLSDSRPYGFDGFGLYRQSEGLPHKK